MMRHFLRTLAILLVIFVLIPAAFTKTPARAGDDPKNSSEATAAPVVDTPPPPDAAKADEVTAPAAPAEATPAAAVPTPATPAAAANDEYRPAPVFTPLLATTGTLGLLTLETADTLPKHGFAFSAFGNKFGRMPGSVTILEIGMDLSYGITDTLNFYASFDPYGHVHVGCPGQLSLNSTPLNTCAPLGPVGPGTASFYQTAPGAAPGWLQDYPFAYANNGGTGDLTFGLKYAFLSERHGDHVSFSVRNDFTISTKSDETKLLNDGIEGSPLTDMVSLAVSKQWGNFVTATFNFGYKFVRAPRDPNAQILVAMPDQVKTGAGLLFAPQSRFEPMMEYNGTIFTSVPATPPDNSFGARDPLEGIWGLRMYPLKNLGIDIGYRRMINLRDLNDRNGFVIKIGTAYWPAKAPPVNHPPTITCTADKSQVYFESGDMVTVSCNASDPDNDPLTYTWSSTCGKVDGNGPTVRWLSAGVPVGSCTITAKVDDGRGGSASSSVNESVVPKPNHPPTITCSADRTSVFVGERVHITTNASDPDGDPLTYTWRTNGGQIVGSGAAVDLDTSGVQPGNYTVTVRVDDGRGGAADCTSTIEVKAVPPPPQASKIADCPFAKPLSTRTDNSCKRFLDDVALRLQNEPRGNAVIIGYSDPKEGKTPDKVASDRATNAVKYLGEKGIDPSRVTTRTGTGQAGATDNRRIDVIWVPEGATY